jgi:hypothetical protein
MVSLATLSETRYGDGWDVKVYHAYSKPAVAPWKKRSPVKTLDFSSQRLAWRKDDVSPRRTDVREFVRDGVTRFSYRLSEKAPDGPVASLNGYLISDGGHLQVSIYFHNAADVPSGSAASRQRAASWRDE